ncbi:MAG TPA: carboxypeptidase-like regulatory domain-containing protein [Bryobacteraceae bacterium]|jgi:hypothetical protein|nr:carboxypeptidase-like regulatory domain-containing protein [Bryobacteraceae bacterium]
MNRLCLLSLVCRLVLFADSQHEIQGRVVDAQTGAPVVHARVTVTFFQPGIEPFAVSLLTDEGGAFDLENAPEGQYRLICERAGYLSGNQPPGPAQPASSSPDVKPAPLVIRLMPQAVIEGSVVDEKGAPVALATVQIFRQTIVEGHRQPQMVGAGNQCDDTGSFRIFGLNAGRYWVAVTPPRAVSQRSKVAYPQVFYPRSPDIAGAELMDLQPGQERHLRIRLPEPVPAREIRGQVAPAADSVNIALRPANGPLFSQFLNFSNQWDRKTKTFKVWGVPSGVYVLEVYTNVEDQQLHASMTVTVGNGDVTGIRLEPRPPATISGVVRFEGKEKPAGFLAGGIQLRSPHAQFGVQPDADGNFKFNDSFRTNGSPDDVYRLVSPSDGPVYLRSAWQGGRDVLRDGLAVSTESESSPLEIVVGGPGGTVEGTLDLGDSSEPANVIVALLRHAGNEMVLEKQAYVNRSLPAGAIVFHSGAPAFQGGKRFTIQGIAPGDYVLHCWAANSLVPYGDPDFLEQYGTKGKAITVSGTEKVSVTLDRLVPRIDP